MATNDYSSSIQPDSFLEVDPLHLSANGALDDFDFGLGLGPEAEGEGDCDPPERLLSGSSCASAGRKLHSSSSSAEIDVLLLLRDSRGSVGMDFQFDSLTGSMNKMSVDVDGDAAMHEHKTEKEPTATAVTASTATATATTATATAVTKRRSGNYRTTRRKSLNESWPGSAGQASKRFEINAVNFDPPSEPPKRRRHSHMLRPARPVSFCGLPPPTATDQQPPPPMPTGEQYGEALQKLADSMKRTEESRRHVMMQRAMLTPSQRQALSTAKERLNGGGGGGEHRPRLCEAPPSRDARAGGDPGDAASRPPAAAAFFSGSRGTLTNGLEHSRKQLDLYNGPVNNQIMHPPSA